MHQTSSSSTAEAGEAATGVDMKDSLHDDDDVDLTDGTCVDHEKADDHVHVDDDVTHPPVDQEEELDVESTAGSELSLSLSLSLSHLSRF